MSALDLALKFEGASDDLVAGVDAAIPIIEDRLGPDMDKIEAIFEKKQDFYSHLEQAWPIILARFPDIKTMAPTALAFLKFIRTKV
jgi:hypothetical protein